MERYELAMKSSDLPTEEDFFIAYLYEIEWTKLLYGSMKSASDYIQRNRRTWSPMNKST